jgi:hypothetical protein
VKSAVKKNEVNFFNPPPIIMAVIGASKDSISYYNGFCHVMTFFQPFSVILQPISVTNRIDFRLHVAPC